jgi:glutaredoxin
MAKVTLYSKPDCPLCDDARRAVERVRERAPFALDEIDITKREGLLAEFGERIPVVSVEGREAFELFVDERELERLVSAAPEAVR